MALIEFLEWDSTFFERKIGRVSVRSENEFAPFQFINEAKNSFDLVYVFSFQEMLSHKTITLANLALVDIMLTMRMTFNKSKYLAGAFDFRNTLSGVELAACYGIAEQTAIVSRFYKEPLIGPEKTKALYRKWIDNALNKTHSDGIFVLKKNGIIEGIHIIRTDIPKKEGCCTLIGVGKDMRNIGIGKRLWESAYSYWSKYFDIDRVVVPFSMQNLGSLNFHLKMGFDRITEVKYIYHYRNRNR
jgi:dTDP-4-amino-4,6-dideoxy-D-galactose acyltransferase